MRYGVRLTAAGLAAALLLALCGCALLPVEETLPDAPITRRDPASEFTMTFVQRGDLARTQRYSVTYRAVRQEKLCFAQDGLRVENVYVAKGDSVRVGQLLMELEQEPLQARCDEAQARCDEAALALAQAQENRELARGQYALTLRGMDEEQREDAPTMEEALRGHDRSIQRLEDELALARQELTQLREELEKRQLRAGIDGVVTFVRSVQPDERSSVSQIMVILSDSDSALFVVSTKAPEIFPEGLEVEVNLNQTVYPCTVISAQEAGASGEDEVYLRCSLPTAELSDGDSGYLYLELERCEDVLYVERTAVKSMDGKQFVYMQDEDGLRCTRQVTTGREVGSFVEILSGLDEGDAVILR